jgi:chaperone modulatory protein CbpM
MHRREFLLAAQLESRALETWIEDGWLVPRKKSKAGPFSEIDVARAQLIRDLGKLGVNEEGIPIILDLLDQLHGLRSTLRGLLSTMAAQPAAQKRRSRRRTRR